MTKEELEKIIVKANPILKPTNTKKFEATVEEPKDGVFPIRFEFLITDTEYKKLDQLKNLKFANMFFSHFVKQNLLNYFGVHVKIKSSKLTKIGQL